MIRLKQDYLVYKNFPLPVRQYGHIVQLAVFFLSCDTDFNIFKELVELVPMRGTTTV